MKMHLTWPTVVVLALLLAAFSTGSPIFLTAAVLIVLLVAFSFLGVWQAARTLEVHSDLSGRSVQRGESVMLTVTVKHRGIIPIAPMLLELYATPDTPETAVRLKDAPGRTQKLTLPFHAAHVGVSSPGVKSCTVEDLFGLFAITKQPKAAQSELLVLPLPFQVEQLTFAPGDSGLETMARATEDVTNPSDIRAYMPGDALKKIHWKLSARKRELVVRRFEEPVLPDALVLMDCSPPPSWGHPEAEADVRDSLLETAASVMNSQMATDHAVRLPLLGEHPVELDKAMGMPMILENLARVDFSETDKFERVLLLETRRMRKVGATVVISARLSSHMVDVMIRMRRMGPIVRLYLVTFTPDDPMVLPLISKLQQGQIEVCYVTPVPA
ncbi:MAG: DUF58 domain-containing protein [Clostridia bacterium]|nr:DUF58 domain-containing protein [Clostridia bacterium]